MLALITAVAAAVVPVGALVLMGGGSQKPPEKKPKVIALSETKPPPPPVRPPERIPTVVCGDGNMKEVSRNGHDSGAGFSFLNDAVYNDPQTDVRNDNSAYTGDVYRDPLSGNTYACLEEKLSGAHYSRRASWQNWRRSTSSSPRKRGHRGAAERPHGDQRRRDRADADLPKHDDHPGPGRQQPRAEPRQPRACEAHQPAAPGPRSAPERPARSLQDPVWARDAGGPGSDYTVRLPRTARSDINCASRGTGPQMTGNHRPGMPNNLVNSRMVPDPRGRQTMSSVNLRQDTRNAQYMMVASNKNRFNVESTHVGGGTTFGHVGHRHGEGELLSYMSSKREHRQEAHHNSGASSLHEGSPLRRREGGSPGKGESDAAKGPTAAARTGGENRRPQSRRTYTERPGAGMGSLRARETWSRRTEFLSRRPGP